MAKARERKMDDAVEMTFPASDPTAPGRATGTEPASRPANTAGSRYCKEDIERAARSEHRVHAEVLSGRSRRQIIADARSAAFSGTLPLKVRTLERKRDPPVLGLSAVSHCGRAPAVWAGCFWAYALVRRCGLCRAGEAGCLMRSQGRHSRINVRTSLRNWRAERSSRQPSAYGTPEGQARG